MNSLSLRKKTLAYFKFIRINQWFKNLLIILPTLTTQKVLTIDNYKSLITLFITFSLVSSLIYIINDWTDLEGDKKHPIKKNNPLPKNDISFIDTLFIVFCILLILLILFFQTNINNENILIIISYFILSILYSLFLKRIIYIDVMLVSIFYVLRIKCGVNEIDENISYLIYFLIYLASVFILFCKRYSDLIYTKGISTIINIYQNNHNVLKLLINLTLIANIIAYLLIINSEYLIGKYGDKPYFITAIFVIISFAKYRYYTFKKNNTIDPVKTFFKSKTLIISNTLWVLSIFVLNNLW